MNIKITGKELRTTESINDYVERKMERLEKYFGEEFDVLATIKTEGNDQIAEIDVMANKEHFRAVTAHRDLYASIDKDVDILEGQIRKSKTKKDKQNKEDSIRQKDTLDSLENENVVENEILKVQYYDIKPMSPDDAKLELQGRQKDLFLTFINIDTGKVNVIFKLKDGKNYGIVEPEA